MPTDYRTRLKELRLRRAVTQKQLAAAVGLTASHVSMIEAGKREVRVPTMIAMLKALGSTMGEFFDPQPRAGHDLQPADIVSVTRHRIGRSRNLDD
jgi:transcriptional regulator with XRE-family HTH domain